MMLGLHRAALPRALDPLGATALVPCRPSQRPPASSQRCMGPALGGIGYGPATYVMSSRLDGSHFSTFGEVVGDRAATPLLGEEPEQFQAGRIVVVPGERSGVESRRR